MTPSIGPGSWPLSFNAVCTFFTLSLPPPLRPELFELSLLISEELISELVLFVLFDFAESLLFEVSDVVPISAAFA
jgi:hypothetical protein